MAAIARGQITITKDMGRQPYLRYSNDGGLTFTAATPFVENGVFTGRNLILGSPNFLLQQSNNDNTNRSVLEGDYVKITFAHNGNVYNNTGIKTSISRTLGDTYTLSFEVNTNAVYGLYFYPSENYVKSNFIPNTNGAWQKITFTYTQTGATQTGSTSLLFGFYQGIAGAVLKYRNLKLERGDVSTDWSPAPEEQNFGLTPGKYLGTSISDLPYPPMTVGAYSWALIKGTDGTNGVDAISYKLIPVTESASVQGPKAGNNIIVNVSYNIQKSVGASTVSNITSLSTEGMTLNLIAGSQNYPLTWNGTVFQTSATWIFANNMQESVVVALKRGSDILDRRVIPVRYLTSVTRNTDSALGLITDEVKNARGQSATLQIALQGITTAVNGKVGTTTFQQTSDSFDLRIARNTGNLIWYSGFEPLKSSSDRPNSGVNGGYFPNFSIDTSIVKFSGVPSLKIVMTGYAQDVWGGSWWANNIKVDGNGIYTFSFYLFSDDYTSIDPSAYYEIQTYDSTGTLITTSYQYSGNIKPTASNQWFLTTISFTTPANASTVSVIIALARNGRLWISCPNLVEGAVAETGPLLAKGEELLPTGINIQNKSIDVNTNNFNIYNLQGEKTVGIDADGNIIAGSLETKNKDGLYSKMRPGIFEVGLNNMPFLQAAVDSNGNGVLLYKDKDGKVVGSIDKNFFNQEYFSDSWTNWPLKKLAYEPTKWIDISNIKLSDCTTFYQYYEGYTLNGSVKTYSIGNGSDKTVPSQYNECLFTVMNINNPIPDGWYSRDTDGYTSGCVYQFQNGKMLVIRNISK